MMNQDNSENLDSNFSSHRFLFWFEAFLTDPKPTHFKLQFISRFLDSQKFKNKAPDPLPSKILEVMRHIQVHLKEDLTVSYLAERANLHQDYFSRLFLRYTGQRPLNYLHEKRIERAQYLIATTNLSYTEIAEEIGFENISHFSKVFKKVTSITPGEYKKQNRV